jgi:hypothetical protein
MSKFVPHALINKTVRAVLENGPVRCAVAFWGHGAARLFGNNIQEARIICNLQSGATNPNEIKILQGRPTFKIRQCDTLHAKVYIGRSSTVVASANASANGLGLEGREQDAWLEAGVLLDDPGPAGEWFDELWDNKTLVRDITDADIRQAQLIWKTRQARKPSLDSFAAFEPEHERPPLICWYENKDWEYDRGRIKSELHLATDAEISGDILRRIDYGLEPENDGVIPILEDRWVLFWRPTQRRLPDRRSRLSWHYLGHQIIRGAWYYEDDDKTPRDVILEAEDTPPPPFEVNEENFFSAFADLLAEPDYDALRKTDSSWSEVDRAARRFWKALHRGYILRVR